MADYLLISKEANINLEIKIKWNQKYFILVPISSYSSLISTLREKESKKQEQEKAFLKSKQQQNRLS